MWSKMERDYLEADDDSHSSSRYSGCMIPDTFGALNISKTKVYKT